MEAFSALLALCAGNSPVPVNSPHKGQWRGALMFSLIYAWINDWVNDREAGDLRRQCGHYDVIVMSISQEICTRFCCALLCCGYAILHNECTWSIYPYSSGLLCRHWGNRTGTIVRLPQCQWSKPDGYGKISQCITTTKHSKAKTVCIFLGIYCMYFTDQFYGLVNWLFWRIMN